MNKIGSYGVYRNSYYGDAQQKEKSGRTQAGNSEKSGAASRAKSESLYGTSGKQDVRLSNKAQSLLEELKEKYSNMDFTVANYSGDEEAAQYLSGSDKEFSVVIEPEILEQMAADKGSREKYEKLLQDSENQLTKLIGRMGGELDDVKKLGVSIKKDGTASYFAELEKTSAKQKERIEKAKEEKTEEKKADAKKTDDTKQDGKGRTIRIESDTPDKLLYQIRHMHWTWDGISIPEKTASGARFDQTV